MYIFVLVSHEPNASKTFAHEKVTQQYPLLDSHILVGPHNVMAISSRMHSYRRQNTTQV